MDKCKHPEDQRTNYHDDSVFCYACKSVVEQHGNQIEQLEPLSPIHNSGESSPAPTGYKCPHCGEELKYLMTWWYDMKCPPSGIGCSCEHCGGGIEISPKTKFIVKAL